MPIGGKDLQLKLKLQKFLLLLALYFLYKVALCSPCKIQWPLKRVRNMICDLSILHTVQNTRTYGNARNTPIFGDLVLLQSFRRTLHSYGSQACHTLHGAIGKSSHG